MATRIPKITETVRMQMTVAQEMSVERLAHDILLSDGLGKRFVGEHEFKEFEIIQFEGDLQIYLTTEVGMKNDEGKMSSILCRTRRMIRIGKRGGCTLLNAKNRRGGGVRKRGRRGHWEAAHALTE